MFYFSNGNSFGFAGAPVLPPEVDPVIQSLPWLFRQYVPGALAR